MKWRALIYFLMNAWYFEEYVMSWTIFNGGKLRMKNGRAAVSILHNHATAPTTNPTAANTHELLMLSPLVPLVAVKDPQHESRLYETPLAVAATSKTDPLKLPKL